MPKDKKRGLPRDCFASRETYVAALDAHQSGKESAKAAAQFERAAAELAKLRRYADKDGNFAARNAGRIEQLNAMLAPQGTGLQQGDQARRGQLQPE
jgi:hypothetical protein